MICLRIRSVAHRLDGGGRSHGILAPLGKIHPGNNEEDCQRDVDHLEPSDVFDTHSENMGPFHRINNPRAHQPTRRLPGNRAKKARNTRMIVTYPEASPSIP